jgi:hypothetical protein
MDFRCWDLETPSARLAPSDCLGLWAWPHWPWDQHVASTIESISRGARGERYQATYAGAVLIESSRDVEFDACRALLAQGITGKLQVWWRGGSFPAMILDIEGAARLTISETDKGGLHLVAWRPFVAVDARDGVASCAVSPRIAAGRSAATP